PLQLELLAVAGDAALLVHHSLAAPDEAIHERRLADVRVADDGDRAGDPAQPLVISLGQVAASRAARPRWLPASFVLAHRRHTSTVARETGGTASRGNPARCATYRNSRSPRSSSSSAWAIAR